MQNKEIFYCYDDLVEWKIFQETHLEQIKSVLRDVLLNKKPEKITFDSLNVWIYIFPNGNMVLVKKDE